MHPVTTPCSDASRARGEPLVATASRVQRWVLVQQCGPWGPPSLPTARMPRRLADRLRSEAARLEARLVLLRHPHGVRCPPGRRLFVVDSGPGSERVLQRTVDDDEQLLSAELPSPDGEEPGWVVVDQPLLLVCTHGRHDRCCAVRGRPVSLALSARWPDRTWECTHIGGDRFAANVVVLPAGDYLGRVGPEQAVDAVQSLFDGRIPAEVHRGRSSLPLPVQAAQAFARRVLGRDRADDLGLLAQTLEATDVWHVRLAGAGRRPAVDVRVRFDRSGPAVPLTCDAQRPRVAGAWHCELT